VVLVWLIVLHYDIPLRYTVTVVCCTNMNKEESIKLGQNLKRIRTKKGISQGDIARALDVSRGYISNIENGKTNPTLATISRLAKAVNVSINELIK